MAICCKYISLAVYSECFITTSVINHFRLILRSYKVKHKHRHKIYCVLAAKGLIKSYKVASTGNTQPNTVAQQVKSHNATEMRR